MIFIKKRKNSYAKKLIAAADRERDSGNPSGAAPLYRAAIESFGNDHGILMQLGNSLKDSKNFPDAKKTYEAALEIKPNDSDCLLQLGHLHKLMGNNEEALSFYHKSADLDSEDNPAIDEISFLSARLQASDSESFNNNLSNNSHIDKMNIFFGTSRDCHGWNLNLDAMRFYKKISIYNGWRR